MTAYQGELGTLTLPEFGLPRVEPASPATLYRARMTSFRQRVHAEGYDVAIVFGDREHFANLTYLTGYDPRFEEAMLVVDLNGGSKPLLVVGNEGYGYVPISPVAADFELVLFQSFSLLGQDRSRSRKLAEILRDGGVEPGTQVGIAGWKYFSSQESATPDIWLETPAYLADTLRTLTGDPSSVRNATAILMRNTAYYTSNIEDGIALADAGLRAAFAQYYPEAWGRIQARRAFMQDVLGIQLKPEVLPFSNIPAYLPPFWLSPQQAMRLVYKGVQ